MNDFEIKLFDFTQSSNNYFPDYVVMKINSLYYESNEVIDKCDCELCSYLSNLNNDKNLIFARCRDCNIPTTHRYSNDNTPICVKCVDKIPLTKIINGDCKK